MSDEPTPEAEVQEVPVEAKPGKKPKADKKKPIEPRQSEESQVAAQADAEVSRKSDINDASP